jgi:hypothetical protein
VRNQKQVLAGNPFYRFRVPLVHEKAWGVRQACDLALGFFFFDRK